jgi:membrane-associated HD superfamily phosphohydrolase
MMSSTNDLSTHLLGNRQHEEDDERDLDCCDEEEGCMPCSLKIMYDEELEDSQSSSDNKQSCSLLFPDIFLHFLLFETFGVALYDSPVWFAVNCNLLIFVIVAVIYRQSMKDFKPTCSAVALLPELQLIIILSLMIFDKVVAAFLFLLISIICLAVLAAATNIYSFVVASIYDVSQGRLISANKSEMGVRDFV